MSENTFSLALPPVEGPNVELPHFPTRMQAFIFRSWDTVSAARMAAVLETSAENVRRQAAKMGLPPQRDDLDIWLEKGYISIIRNNWYLLPYEQLLTLLSWDSERLAFVLKEDDFLGYKLGSHKPVCEKILYRELTEEEERRTDAIRRAAEQYILPEHAAGEKAPFSFFEKNAPRTILQDPSKGIVLTDDWCIEDTVGSEVTQVFADRFAEDLRLLCGVRLQRLPAGDAASQPGAEHGVCADVPASQPDANIHNHRAAGPRIRLCLNAAPDPKGEYHEIEITPTQIIVSAADEAGILRGLYYIEDMLRSRHALSCGKVRRRARFGARFIYSYCGLYNDAFDVDSRVYCPDELLEAYSRSGINGIWTQAVLYRMVPFPWEPALSIGWEARQERLREFADRARKYGISVYLYLNEPRSMDDTFFDRYPQLKGHAREDGYTCLCVSTPEVADYLEGGIRMLCRKVPHLGGFFTITRSENLTNCYSHTEHPNCPRCSQVPMHQIICKVNCLIARGAHSVSPSIRVIAWAWGWQSSDDGLAEEKEAIIRHMPEDVILMHTSEEHLAYEVGGIKGTVLDYSMSQPGPGQRAVNAWQLARQTGHETAAKVQLNTTWECSTTPYLPVFGLVKKHLNNLLAQNVDHIMLSWTLGGYPSTNIRIASELFFETMQDGATDSAAGCAEMANCDGAVNHTTAVDCDEPASRATADCGDSAVPPKAGSDTASADILDAEYGPYAPVVRRATAAFDEAFSQFPFHIGTAYNGPQNGGPSNLLYEKPTGLPATMTCFVFDDLPGWRSIYPEEIFEEQFRKVSEGFEKGLQILNEMPACELHDAAFAGYALFKASYDQIRFVRTRNRWLAKKDPRDRAALRQLVSEELTLAARTYGLMLRNPAVGYEAANHYYFTRGMLAEKILNCAWLLERY